MADAPLMVSITALLISAASMAISYRVYRLQRAQGEARLSVRPEVRGFRTSNLGYSVSVNQGFKHGDDLILVYQVVNTGQVSVKVDSLGIRVSPWPTRPPLVFRDALAQKHGNLPVDVHPGDKITILAPDWNPDQLGSKTVHRFGVMLTTGKWLWSSVRDARVFCDAWTDAVSAINTAGESQD